MLPSPPDLWGKAHHTPSSTTLIWQLRNEQIKSAPFTLNVLPADAFGPACVCFGAGIAAGSVGQMTEFTIEARDKVTAVTTRITPCLGR